MSEGLSDNIIEREIADISKEIEAKRDVLEKEHGIIEEKEVVRRVVAGKIHGDKAAPMDSQMQISPKKDDTKSYLDSMDEESIERVNTLLSTLDSNGIKKAIEEAKKEEAFILDAFHDLLVDRIFEELKNKETTE